MMFSVANQIDYRQPIRAIIAWIELKALDATWNGGKSSRCRQAEACKMQTTQIG